VRRLTTLLALAVLAAAAGCVSAPLGAGYDDGRSAFGEPLLLDEAELEAGRATDSEVLDRLGPPTAITALPEGYAFLYQSGRVRTEGVGINILALRVGYAWSMKELELAVFVFDAAGVLVGSAVDHSVVDAGTGFAFGTQKAEAADHATYLLPLPQHRWGSQFLRSLPVLLNAQSNPDGGSNGLEQHGTTGKVGQRTLASGYITAQNLLELLKAQAGQ
jgi:hypothetical protein